MSQPSTCPKREEFAGAILSDVEDELRDEAEARRREDAEEAQRAIKEESQVFDR